MGLLWCVLAGAGRSHRGPAHHPPVISSGSTVIVLRSIELESSVDGTSHDGSERSNRYTANNINGNNNADREMIMSAIPIVDGERIVL
jgi:hypothetical protein